METKKMKNYLLLQCCVLIGMLSLLPQFDVVSLMGGVDLNLVVMLSKVIVCVLGGLSLYRLITGLKEEGKDMPLPYVLLIALGLVIVFLSVISVSPLWLEYVGAIALLVGIFMGKKAFAVNWDMEAQAGAYLILLALFMQLYEKIDDTMMTSITAIIGLIIYLKGLSMMRSRMDEAGANGCNKLKIAVILSIVSVLVDWIPLMGWLVTILLIVAFIVEYLGYGQLKASTVLTEEGQKGAGTLQTGMILLLVATIIDFFPLTSLVVALLNVVALFLVFFGWNKILLGLKSKETPLVEQNI